MIEHFEQRDGSDKDGQWRLDKLKGDCQANPSVIAYCARPINLKRADATGHALFLFIHILIFFSHVMRSLYYITVWLGASALNHSEQLLPYKQLVASRSITCSLGIV